ncbi:Rhamnolipids biosynthesis 3-oxoacyl-[acyl-carrier-protein] reductase [Ceratocystis fimbriata CBS 114723]|uniref:Rhamnolipids biosynthesis 3-oxoacyl-[acyl-carrier-protein] reductase n=1 Tax=Ceratocystis fimbriata CBS 114723 TaxID=1035309 RepID=A0A2C5WQR0_9PEZI|nr:Rhamnolipids biosynthesis 3-oxoacyl-[acyl-carrier-protein] reductase [Ceratocystis fimbriata CBS 114723]
MAEHELHDFASLFSLKGKVAVVTGGSRGLGLQAASGLLQAGCSKVFISSRKKKVCDDACAALNALPNLQPGAKAISVPADSATVAGIEALVAAVKEHTSKIDILFANAGATWGEAIETHGDAAFSKVMDLNVKGVFNAIRLFLPLLEKDASIEDPARIIVTGSVAGIGRGPPNTYGYTASKAAVMHLAKNLAVELGPRHISVNSIAPGFFPSKMTNGLINMGGGMAAMAEGNPMGRLGRGEDIAGAVVFLASRAGAHVNGDILTIDGGSLMLSGEMNVESKL